MVPALNAATRKNVATIQSVPRVINAVTVIVFCGIIGAGLRRGTKSIWVFPFPLRFYFFVCVYFARVTLSVRYA